MSFARMTSQGKLTLQWRESLTKLPDNIFFELMRMYLGEIKTPYHKQHLIERLGAFLHKEQVQKKILLLLTPQDCQILSAVFYLEKPTTQLLAAFFSGTFSTPQLQEHLMNLEERLLIFRNTSGLLPNQRPAFYLNPILETVLRQKINPSILLPLPKEFQNQVEPHFLPQLNHNLLAALFSFTKEHHQLCRQDGTLKKRTVQQLSQMFPFTFTPELVDFFQTLVMSLKHLSLLKESPGGLEPDQEVWAVFAQLPLQLQVAYLAAAACGRDTKSKLQHKAGLFLSMAHLCPPEGFTQDAFARMEFLLQQSNAENLALKPKKNAPSPSSLGSRAGGSRFARMMEAAEKNRCIQKTTPSEELAPSKEPQEALPEEVNLLWCNSLFEAGRKLGLFRPTGTGLGVNRTVQTVYHPQLGQELPSAPEPGHLTLDSALTATLLPGLRLPQILPLLAFMRVTRYDTAISLSITKDTCHKGFDSGLTPKDIEEKLGAYTRHHLPQSFSVSLEDWFHSYSMATLYKGYVLQLKEKKDISSHPVLAKHIVTQLEEGIYLMNFSSDAEAQKILSKGGFDNLGAIKKPPVARVLPSFPQNIPDTSREGFLDSQQESDSHWHQQEVLQQSHVQELEARLAQMDLSRHQKEGLQFRINRRIIVLPEQLQGSSVKMEQYEATGMDFVGKVHVADQAIHQGNILKLTYLQPNNEPREVAGSPVELQKVQGDTLVVLQKEQRLAAYSLGQAQKVRRIQGSIFAGTLDR